ncbi:tape measure protein [Mycobacterium marinum]|uniref:tape measure protein n=1 Tax=Mycobacterium marinum TaxID=1781 RepID=UPI0035640162
MAGYETAAGKAGAVAGRAMGMAFTTAATGLIGAAGYTLFKGFERYEAIDSARARLDNLNQTLAATGRATQNVGAVMETVNQVVLDTPFRLDEAFSVATRALASNTGDLKRFMTITADAAGFAGESIGEIGDAFLKIANQGKATMQEVNNQLQRLNIMPWLADTLHMTGAEVAKAMHDGKIALKDILLTVEQHAPNFAKAMNNTVAGSIENVKTSIARLGANFLGAIFGKPAEDANQLVDIMRALREHIDEIGEWVSQHQNDIRDFFKNAATIGSELVEVFGKIAKALSDHPGLVYAIITAWAAFKAANIAGNIAGIITKVTALNTAMGALPSTASTAAAGMSTAFGPVALMFAGVAAEFAAIYLAIRNAKIEMPTGTGLLPGATDQQRQIFAQGGTGGLNSIPRSQGGFGPEPGEPGYVPPGSTPGSATPPRYYPFGLKGPSYVWVPGKGYQPEGFVAPGTNPAGSPLLDATGSAGSSGPRLPKAPVVPFDMSVPPGIPGLPQTAATYGAETSFLEARHRLAEKRARLNQLEHTANATAEDVLDARNDVLEAQRSQQQAEMRLAEARQNELEKYTKHMRQGADTLGDIGAQLDQDFGISKGLAGIAENITKFLANLAAAPVIGALSGVQMGLGYKPGEAGSGLLAMAAGAGAFGPQHQVLPWGGQYPGLPTGYGGYGGVGYGGMPGIGVPASYGVPAGANIYSGPHTTDTHGALTPRAAALRSLISQMFGVTNIGGYRPPDGFNEHSSGEALDIMVGDNAALGDQINQFLQANAGPLGLEYSLWQQQQWTPGQGPTPMENRGSGTQNHRDHVHARVRPGPLGGGGQVAPSGYGTAPTGGGPGWWGSPGSPGGAPGAPGAPGGTGPIPGAPGSPGVPFPGTQSPLVPGGGGPLGGPGTGIGAPGAPQLGRYPGQGLNIPKGEGIGIGGGALGLLQQAIPTAINGAIGAAGAAGGMAAPGAGAGAGAAGAIISAAAQIGIDEINRAIGFGAQAVGIGAGGLLETFIPNESPLADFSGGWFGRIAGAVAGVNAQIPNIAGQVSQAVNNATGGQGLSPGLTPEQVAGQPDQRGANQGNVDQSVTNNVTVNGASIPNEDSMGNTVSAHLGAMWQR